MTQQFNYLKAAKEFADTYGAERLDRLMTLAETAQGSPNSQPTPTESYSDNSILQEVEAAGFQLNPWLKNLLLTTSVEVVRNAMAVVAENQQRGIIVRNPEGLLVEAIRNHWKPDLSA